MSKAVAGEKIERGDLVRFADDGKIYKAQAGATDAFPFVPAPACAVEIPRKTAEQGNEDRFAEAVLKAIERIEHAAIMAGWSEIEFWDQVEIIHESVVAK